MVISCIFRKDVKRRILKKNPLKNYRVMVRLNPYAKHAKKEAKHIETIRKRKKEELLNKKRGVSLNLVEVGFFLCLCFNVQGPPSLQRMGTRGIWKGKCSQVWCWLPHLHVPISLKYRPNTVYPKFVLMAWKQEFYRTLVANALCLVDVHVANLLTEMTLTVLLFFDLNYLYKCDVIVMHPK